MRINIFGLGYVGCVSAACLAKDNHKVTGFDVDPTKLEIINSGKSPIVEEGLNELIYETTKSGNLTTSEGKNPPPADVSIICVGTPSNENGSLDLKYLREVGKQIGLYLKVLNSYHVVVNRSTVLPGTLEEVLIPILEKYSGKKVGKDFGLSMNPEFMREGTSIHDYYNPPFTVIGEYDKRSGDIIEEIYKNISAPIYRTNLKVAEMLKYSCNSFHAVKVTFANEIGILCKKFNIDSHDVMNIFINDKKLNISGYYLKPGFAFGGSCLPKDLRAINHKSKELDLELPLLNSLLVSNKYQIENAFNLISKLGKKRVVVLGLSFKAGTDDLRESPMVELIEKLIGKGFNIKIYDQEVSMAKIFGSNKKYIETIIPHISSLMETSLEKALENSEVILIGKSDKNYKDILTLVPIDAHIIDLVKLFTKEEEPKSNYEGICW